MDKAHDPFSAMSMSIAEQKLAQQQEIAKMLREKPPQTVRRVLPRSVVERHLKYHLKEMQTMMKSFEAILTFPTEGRKLPQAVLSKMQKQLGHDLRSASGKLNSEVEDLLSLVRKGIILQSNIMLDVVAATPFPFCLLNDIVYHPRDNRGFDNKLFVPAQVILWTQQEKKDGSIKVWLEISPHDPVHYKWLKEEELRSSEYMIHFPAGEAHFCAFETAVSIVLYGLPSEMEATMAGKNYKQLLNEYTHLRDSLVRRKDDSGEFLHILWKYHRVQKEVDQGFLV
jgi:hypothetical protein